MSNGFRVWVQNPNPICPTRTRTRSKNFWTRTQNPNPKLEHGFQARTRFEKFLNSNPKVQPGFQTRNRIKNLLNPNPKPEPKLRIFSTQKNHSFFYFIKFSVFLPTSEYRDQFNTCRWKFQFLRNHCVHRRWTMSSEQTRTIVLQHNLYFLMELQTKFRYWSLK